MKNTYHLIAALLVIYTIVLISGCNQNTQKPEISAVSTAELKLQRFEADLFGMDVTQPATAISKLKEYGDFLICTCLESPH